MLLTLGIAALNKKQACWIYFGIFWKLYFLILPFFPHFITNERAGGWASQLPAWIKDTWNQSDQPDLTLSEVCRWWVSQNQHNFHVHTCDFFFKFLLIITPFNLTCLSPFTYFLQYSVRSAGKIMASPETQPEKDPLAVLVFSMWVFRTWSSVGSADKLSDTFWSCLNISQHLFLLVTGFLLGELITGFFSIFSIRYIPPCNSYMVKILVLLWEAQFTRRTDEGLEGSLSPVQSPAWQSWSQLHWDCHCLWPKYSLPLQIACGVLEKTAKDGWVCPFLKCFCLCVSSPPIWTFRKVIIFLLLFVIIFPIPLQYFTVTTKFFWRNCLSPVLSNLCWLQEDKMMSGGRGNKQERNDQGRSNDL